MGNLDSQKLAGSVFSRYSQSSQRQFSKPLAAAMAFALFGVAQVSQAATFTVSNTLDSGAGSLRQAVLDANDAAGADVINFNIRSGSVINLAGSELLITDSVTIMGSAAGNPNSVTINGGSKSQLINATIPAGGLLKLENLTLKNGSVNARGGGLKMAGSSTNRPDLILNDVLVTGNSTSGNAHEGGGLYVANTDITLNRTTVSNNSTIGNGSPGGGIFAYEITLTLNDSIISGNKTTGNKSPGGGIYTDGNTTLNNSTVSRNSTSGSESHGGGLYIYLSTYLNNSTISGNSTTGAGSHAGGIGAFGNRHTNQSKLVINQSTISGNSATGHGGGVGAFYVQTKIKQSTITNNTSTSGAGGLTLLTPNLSLNVDNTILSKNTGRLGDFFKVSGASTFSHSLIGTASSAISGTGNVFSTNPNLGTLKNNGGKTLTHLPNAGSPTLDKGSNTAASAFTIDQRGTGYSRIQKNTIDIGAVELQTDPPPVSAFTFDIDNNNKVEALTDGLLVLRYLFGFSGNALTGNAIGNNAQRTNASDIQTYLQTAKDSAELDIDGNGQITALTDGLLVLRYLFGFTGQSLIDNAVGSDANRTSATSIEAYLQRKMP